MINKLIELGLSENEAKAYIALVKKNPATAYEVALGSNIPTSKIYGVLSRLQEKEVVSVLEDEKKKKYIPIAPDEFIEQRRNKIDKTLSSLKKDLSQVQKKDEVSYVWNIHDYEYLLEKAERMIKSAKKNILISGWKEELVLFEKELKQRENKKVKISIVHFGEAALKTGCIFQHPIEDTLYQEKGGRGLVIIVDGKEAMLGTVFSNNRIEGAWSLNSGFVTLAEDYIKHDIYIMKIVKRFDSKLKEKFGENYKKLRDIFTDEEI